MVLQKGGVKPVLTVIHGTGRAEADHGLPLPPAPQFCGDELAAELAQLYAFALVQDMPLADLDDPHADVPSLRETSLHDLLCEMRGLHWFDQDHAAPPAGVLGSAMIEERLRRRARNWNRDGQLTLPILTRGPVALQTPVRSEGARHLVAGPCERPDQEAPDAGACLERWHAWCAEARGAVAFAEEAAPQTLREVTQTVAAMPASRPFFALCLEAIESGHVLDAGLCDTWEPADVLSLLARAEKEALGLSLQRVQRDDRALRPAVMAARVSARLSREDRAPGDLVTVAAQDLAYSAPHLLDWVHQANVARRSDRKLERTLFLPISPADDIPVHSADLAGHVMVAGAMATIIKAAFDTMPVHDVAQSGGRLRAADLDQVCSDIALARCVAATHYAVENHQESRIGEALALRMMRNALAERNLTTRIGLTDFDGTRLELRSRSGRFGRAAVTLYRAGQPVDWPLSLPAGAHLTAVS